MTGFGSYTHTYDTRLNEKPFWRKAGYCPKQSPLGRFVAQTDADYRRNAVRIREARFSKSNVVDGDLAMRRQKEAVVSTAKGIGDMQDRSDYLMQMTGKRLNNVDPHTLTSNLGLQLSGTGEALATGQRGLTVKDFSDPTLQRGPTMEDISDQVTLLSTRVGEAFVMINDKLMQINDEVDESNGVTERVMDIVNDTNKMVYDLSTIVENDLASKKMLDDAASNLSKELRKINQTLDETEASKVLNDASNSLFASIQNHMTPSSRSANEILATRTIEQRKKIAELEQELEAAKKKPLSTKKQLSLKKAVRTLRKEIRRVRQIKDERSGSGSGLPLTMEMLGTGTPNSRTRNPNRVGQSGSFTSPQGAASLFSSVHNVGVNCNANSGGAGAELRRAELRLHARHPSAHTPQGENVARRVKAIEKRMEHGAARSM